MYLFLNRLCINFRTTRRTLRIERRLWLITFYSRIRVTTCLRFGPSLLEAWILARCHHRHPVSAAIKKLAGMKFVSKKQSRLNNDFERKAGWYKEQQVLSADNEHSSSCGRLRCFIWFPSPTIELTYSRSLSPFQASRPEGKRERECDVTRSKQRTWRGTLLQESGFDLGIYHRYRQPLIWHCAPADTGSGSSIFSWRVNDWPLPRRTAPEGTCYVRSSPTRDLDSPPNRCTLVVPGSSAR